MAGDIDVNGIDRRRSALRQRIRELDKAQCKTARELNRALLEQAKAGVELMRLDVVKAVFKCFEHLVESTPVDTGRARASWSISNDSTTFLPAEGIYPEYKGDDIKDAIGQALRGVRGKLVESDVLYVYTNLEYMLALNAGWSKKQAGGFIDQFLQELRSELSKAAAARGNAA